MNRSKSAHSRSTPPPLRVGIAGTGFAGSVHALAARAAGAVVVGVAASTPERAREAAERIGATHAFASAEQLVEADGIDVIHVCTPNDLHLPLAERAFAAGKHVICEKPIALDLADALAVQAAAEQADKVGAVPFVYRYHPMAREARERIRRGDAGEVKLIHGSYMQDWLLSPEDDNWRVDEQLGGASRAFADIGSHWCDLAELVSGHRIVRLCARTLTAVPARGGSDERVSTEDAAIVQFETAGGALGSVIVSQVSAGRKNRLWLQVDGTLESLAFDQEDAERLWCGRREATTILHRDPATLSPAAARLAFLPSGHAQGYQDCFRLFVADAYDAIQSGVVPDGLPQLCDGVRTVQLTDLVLESAREQRWVEVASLDSVVTT